MNSYLSSLGLGFGNWQKEDDNLLTIIVTMVSFTETRLFFVLYAGNGFITWSNMGVTVIIFVNNVLLCVRSVLHYCVISTELLYLRCRCTSNVMKQSMYSNFIVKVGTVTVLSKFSSWAHQKYFCHMW